MPIHIYMCVCGQLSYIKAQKPLTGGKLLVLNMYCL